jgi:hypothetical protein
MIKESKTDSVVTGQVIDLPPQKAKAVPAPKATPVVEKELAALAAVRAARALYDAVMALTSDADFRSIMLIAQAHNFQYKGPDVAAEMKAMQVALQTFDATEKKG